MSGAPREVGSGRPAAIALVGATATGKTAVSEIVAAALGGEIVCADSRQLFRELEIGTGKPDPATRAARPHHLFDALALGHRASAGGYAALAAECCAAIVARGHTPVLVGGSGLYLRALMDGLSASPPHDPERRARLVARAASEGSEALHRDLAEVDPDTAARLAPRDAQRITRALEVWQASGQPLSGWLARRAPPAFEAAWQVVELVVDPAALQRRIEARTRAMLDGGLIEETRELCAAGLEPDLRALRAVGYDESLDLLAGTIGREEAEARMALRTRQLAKRQRTWFRHQIRALRLDAGERHPEDLAVEVLRHVR